MNTLKLSCLLAAASLFASPPAFAETLTWWQRRLPAGCTFLEGDESKSASFVLRVCSRGGERLIKPVSVALLGKGVVAVEMPGIASNYTGIWCSWAAPRLRKGVHSRCTPEGWNPLP